MCTCTYQAPAHQFVRPKTARQRNAVVQAIRNAFSARAKKLFAPVRKLFWPRAETFLATWETFFGRWQNWLQGLRGLTFGNWGPPKVAFYIQSTIWAQLIWRAETTHSGDPARRFWRHCDTFWRHVETILAPRRDHFGATSIRFYHGFDTIWAHCVCFSLARWLCWLVCATDAHRLRPQRKFTNKNKKTADA